LNNLDVLPKKGKVRKLTSEQKLFAQELARKVKKLKHEGTNPGDSDNDHADDFDDNVSDANNECCDN
jgi:hypothetical protein